MMSLKLKEEQREEGFTLIELLVVVIIIGILAAIAIPVFLNQRESAWISSVESDLRNAAMQVETCYTRDGEYPADASWDDDNDNEDICAETDGVEVIVSNGVELDYTNNGETFDIDGFHDSIGDGTEVVATYDSATGGLVGE